VCSVQCTFLQGESVVHAWHCHGDNADVRYTVSWVAAHALNAVLISSIANARSLSLSLSLSRVSNQFLFGQRFHDGSLSQLCGGVTRWRWQMFRLSVCLCVMMLSTKLCMVVSCSVTQCPTSSLRYVAGRAWRITASKATEHVGPSRSI